MKAFALSLCILAAASFGGFTPAAQEMRETQRLRVQVTLVEVDVAVTDSKGNYIRDLKPQDFVILEDNIKEKMTTFEEGSNGPRILLKQDTAVSAGEGAKPILSEMVGPGRESNVFILFDTSNYMYRNFVFAQDAIADFVRSLEGVNKLALYSYSRDLSRNTPLTPDRPRVLRGVRGTVAGDDAALYNGLLLTVKDAAPLSGRKVVVVFTNGPDNASQVPPEDIAQLAQSTGTIIYMLSTREAQENPISSAVFEQLTKTTGGMVYFAKDWKDERQAFTSIRDDIGHLYSLSYYPQANPNRGFRKITVKLVGKNLQKYHIRTREGYRLLRTSEQPASSGFADTGSSPQQ